MPRKHVTGENTKKLRELSDQKEKGPPGSRGYLPAQKERRKGGFWGEAMRTSTSPGTQSYPYLPYSLQEERERAREQIMLKMTEIIMRTVTLSWQPTDYNNTICIPQHPVSAFRIDIKQKVAKGVIRRLK